MKTITIDQQSMEAAGSGQLDLDSLLKDLTLPDSDNFTKCVEIEEHGFILSRKFKIGDGLIIISLEENGPLSAPESDVRHSTLSRLLQCATMIFTGRTRSIPYRWRPFHEGNKIAFQADRRTRNGGKTDAGRVLMAITQEDGPRLFAFLLDRSGDEDIAIFEPDLKLQNAARSCLSKAVESRDEFDHISGNVDQIDQRISLEQNLVGMAAQHLSYADWYTTRLNTNQRRFVDHDLTSSVRLVGAAGSGKTVALTVKCLRELHRAKKQNRSLRILFLTHASSTAVAIENLTMEMDPDASIEALTASPPSLTVTTLYELANRHMRYDLDELTPVSLDGHEGRVLQAYSLNDAIESELKEDWITFRAACSRPFISYMESDKDSAERKFFLWELLNEFACVLDAEGVRSAAERREKYLTDKRKNWMMLLESRDEREVILKLYDRFRSILRVGKFIGSDQMIADFLNYLDSYRWEATREKEGFDAVFVDELHLFNRQERLLLRYLLKDPNVSPAVFMAYDAKQSPRDTFLGMGSTESQQYDLWRDARLGKSEKIELVDVFRYTPQIAKALSTIDQSFPGQDLDADWPSYSGVSRIDDGPIPLVCELDNIIGTYGVVFKRAKAIQLKLQKKQRVAVLCCSYDLFLKYQEFRELKDDFYVISSRDEALDFVQSRNKFIFSMPEYVAGLQYDTVLLIDVNRGEVPEGPYSVASLRKFVSLVYLGASRAERKLEFFASKSQGGIAPLLSLAIATGVINKVDIDRLPKP